MLPFILVFIVAVGLGLLLTRVGRQMGEYIRLLDRPDTRLKRQTRPVAVAGGLTLLVTIAATLFTTGAASDWVFGQLSARGQRWLFVAVAVVLGALVGLIDDLRRLRPAEKLFGQVLSVAVLMLGGEILVRQVTLFGWTLSTGGLSVPITLLWFLFVINALNLLDGMDGMLATLSGVALFGLAAVGFVGNGPAALVAVAALGGLVGFLRDNLPPATVYLGDSGSTVIGVLVGTLTLDVFRTGGAFAPVPALALLVLPLLDTTAAVLRRRLRRVPVSAGDLEHLHHVLCRRGYCIPAALAVVAVTGAVAAALAGLGFVTGSDLLPLGGAVAVATFLLGFGLFGRTEVRLVRGRLCRQHPVVDPFASVLEESTHAR